MNHRSPEVPASETSTEAAIVAAGKTAPRVTPQHISDVIVSKHFFTAADGALGAGQDTGAFAAAGLPVPLCLLTFCVLVLRNGFTVTGESACASPENFDPQIGRDIAERNARDKIWALEGYLLRQSLHEAAAKVA
jgi:hypothetical protein